MAANKPDFMRGKADEYLLHLKQILARNSDDMQHAARHHYRMKRRDGNQSV